MNERASGTTYLICLTGAILMFLLAIYQFTTQGSQGWMALSGAALLGIASAYSQLARKATRRAAESLVKLAEETKDRLERQRSAIDSLADGLEVAIFICNSRAVIEYANRRAIEMFKIDDPVGRSLLAMTLNYDLEQLALDAVRKRSPQSIEMTFSYPMEQVGIAKAWPSEVDNERVFVSIYEITDLRRLERVRQDFVSNVSHELRTPLTIIRSMAETLLDDPSPDPELSAKYLPRIVSEVDRLSTISNDLLILSASESSPVRKSTCDIAELFRRTLEQLSPKAADKGIKTDYEGPDHLTIEANPAQMTQVALNLVENAINYTIQGSVNVRIRSAGDFATIEVRDTGLGIASGHLPRIFERFYRVDKARSRHSGGTGLGLSIVKHIVESHGGKVTVESSLGEGSTFAVTIPVGSPHADPDVLDAS